MHGPSWRLRAYLPVLLATALVLCLAPATAHAALVTDGAFALPAGPAAAFVSTVTVGFDSNGGSAVDTQTLESGSLVETPAPDPTRTGYTFAGWYSDSGLSTPWDFATAPAVADMTLYASWTVNSYEVGFDSNGGSLVDTQTLAFGSLVETPAPDPTKTGYTFAGWYSDVALNTPWDFSADHVGAADMMLYAKWTTNGYQVFFNSNGGSPVGAQQLAFGSLVTRPAPDPMRTGHTFVGWYADAGLTAPWDFSAGHIGAADMTLYAKWTINSYRVSFETNGGSPVDIQTLSYGALIAAPVPEPSRPGFVFAGWYTDALLTTPWDFSAGRVGAADMTLYAKWTVTFTITGSAGAHGSLSVLGATVVPSGSSLTVVITPAAGYGVSNVVVDGISKGALTSYTFGDVAANHTISATFRRVTRTTLSASAKSIRRGRSVTLRAKLKSSTSHFKKVYIRFEVKLPHSKRYILLKKVKLSSTGKATYRYQVLNKGTRHHRARFTGNGTFLPAPTKNGLALRVR